MSTTVPLPACIVSWHLLLHRHAGHDKASVSGGDESERGCSRPERRGSLSTKRSVRAVVRSAPGGRGDAVAADDADSTPWVDWARDCLVSWGSRRVVSAD